MRACTTVRFAPIPAVRSSRRSSQKPTFVEIMAEETGGTGRMRRARSFGDMHLWPAGILPRLVRVVLRAALISLALTYSFGRRAQRTFPLGTEHAEPLSIAPHLPRAGRLSDFAARKRRYGVYAPPRLLLVTWIWRAPARAVAGRGGSIKLRKTAGR